MNRVTIEVNGFKIEVTLELFSEIYPDFKEFYNKLTDESSEKVTLYQFMLFISSIEDKFPFNSEEELKLNITSFIIKSVQDERLNHTQSVKNDYIDICGYGFNGTFEDYLKYKSEKNEIKNGDLFGIGDF